jgi:hypothetical protein
MLKWAKSQGISMSRRASLSLRLLLLAAAFLALTGAGPLPLNEWKGEYFDQKQGGLYLKTQLKGFKASQQTSYITGNVQITIWNILKKKAYSISHPLGDDPEGYPRGLYKLPSGKYEVRQIVMVDAAGTKRVWKADPEAGLKQSFLVKRQCLSNLGLWTLSPTGKVGLAVKFAMIPNTYKEEGAKADSSVAAVLNGYTGLIQEKIGGKKVLKGAASNYEGANELRATITFTRQIAMFYKLDLFRHNYHGKAIANVLTVYDPNLRRCYTDRLDFNDALRGDVKFTFLLSKQTGTMSKLKASGGSASGDPKLVECMYNELAAIQFPVPENMIGELTYIFDVK